MSKAKKSVRRVKTARKSVKPARPHIRTMQQLVGALGGADHIASAISTTNCVLQWFERGYVQRGYGLQVYLSLQARGYTQDRIDPKLFDHPKWTSYTIPVRG